MSDTVVLPLFLGDRKASVFKSSDIEFRLILT